MKILLIDVYHYNKGGAETVCLNTAELLRNNGHEVVFFTLKWDKNYPSPQSKYFPESKETRKGVFKPISNLINYFYHFEAAEKIEQLIKDEKPDIAHIHLMWGQITPSIFPVLKKYNIPILYTAHDYRVVCPAYTFRNGNGLICEECNGRSFYKCFTNKCAKDSYVVSAIMAAEQYFRNTFLNPLKYIDGVIYVSNFAKEIHEKYMPGLRSKKEMVLYNLSLSFDSVERKEEDEKYFLFFGRLSYEKGVKTLMNAFKECKDCKLKIAGTGPLEAELKEFKEANKLDNVEFLGYQTGDSLESLVKNAYFIIVPSEWYENNPMTIIEGYSASVPVIGSKMGGIPEIIVDNSTGFIFESGNTSELSSIVEKANQLSEEKYKQMRSAAYQFAVDNFNPESYYTKLIKFYTRFLKS